MISHSLTPDERRHIEQIDRWVALGTSCIDALLASMSDRSWTVRRASVAALAALGDDAVGPLCDWLRDQRTEEHSIAAAVDALVASIGGSTNRAVIEMLGDRRAVVAADAAQILGRRCAIEAGPMLAAAISHGDDNVAVAAIEALGAVGGSDAIEQLIAIVRGGSFFRTFPALQVLAKSGDPRAVGVLAGMLDDEVYRLEVIRALGRTGSVRAIAPLASLLPEAGVAVVRLVARAIEDLLDRAERNGATGQIEAALHTQVAPALAQFVAALPANDPAEREALAVVLGRIGDVSTVAVLAALSEDPRVRDVAADALRRIGGRDEQAQLAALACNTATRIAMLPAVSKHSAARSLRALLGDDAAEVRARACDALARVGDVLAVPDLFATLGDPNPRVALAATAAIQSLGVADTGARALDALERGVPAVRRAALRIIGYLGLPAAFDAVRSAIDDADPMIANLAVGCLGAITDPRVDAVLAALVGGTDPALRVSAMRAIVQRSGDGARELVERGLVDELPWVRYYACRGAAQLGARAVGELVARLVDPAPHVRIAAIESLAQLETAVAWEALCSVARSTELDERRAALAGIGLCPGPAALPLLVDAARSTDTATRLIALSSLARRPENAALDLLVAAAIDPDSELREAALSLLGERTDRPAAEAMVELALTCGPDHPVQLALAWPGASRIAAIADHLPTVDDRGAVILARALARMADSMATATLLDSLAIANPAARRAGAAMVVAMGVDGGRVAVARLATDDPDPEVRRACAALVAG